MQNVCLLNKTSREFGCLLYKLTPPKRIINFLRGEFGRDKNFSNEDMEDVVQETYEKAFTFKSYFTPEKKYSFRTWVYKIAINCYIDSYRKKKKRKYILKHEDISIFFEDSSSENTWFKNEDKRHLIFLSCYADEELIINSDFKLLKEEVIDRISINEKGKKILEMHYLQQMKLKEISQKMEVPIGTVKATELRFKLSILKEVEQKRLTKYFESYISS